jgi:hypothetical protein
LKSTPEPDCTFAIWVHFQLKGGLSRGEFHGLESLRGFLATTNGSENLSQATADGIARPE